jgi:hypothetical protein
MTTPRLILFEGYVSTNFLPKLKCNEPFLHIIDTDFVRLVGV